MAEHARRKLAAKAADLIVANDVTAEGAGFDQDTNIVTIYTRDGREIAVPRMSKLDVAQRVLDQVVTLLREPGRIVCRTPASPLSLWQTSLRALKPRKGLKTGCATMKTWVLLPSIATADFPTL